MLCTSPERTASVPASGSDVVAAAHALYIVSVCAASVPAFAFAFVAAAHALYLCASECIRLAC